MRGRERLDGNAFFNRPGPRLIESAELAARAIHPEAFADWPEPDPSSSLRWADALRAVETLRHS